MPLGGDRRAGPGLPSTSPGPTPQESSRLQEGLRLGVLAGDCAATTSVD